MGKVKVSNKNGTVTVNVKSDSNENIDMNTVQWFAANPTAGYITPAVSMAGNKFVVSYIANGCTTLKAYIKQGMNQQRFVTIIESLVETLSTMSVHNLNYSNLLLQLNTVLVNQATGKVEVIYYPVGGFNNSKYFNVFLSEILSEVKTDKKSDNTYLTEFNQIISDISNLSWDVLKEYVKKWKVVNYNNQVEINVTGNVNNQSSLCIKCGYVNNANAKFCVKCGTALNNEISQSLRFENFKQQTTENNAQYNIPAYEEEEGTTVLSNFEEDEATTVLSQPVMQRVYPDLTRVSTQENVKVDKDVFNIGKGKNSDYMVLGNSAVSRNHASIIFECGEYYLVDNGSTNCSYLNGNILAPNEKFMLNDGDNIVLANEAFVFSINRN